jgi:hypothetical protein
VWAAAICIPISSDRGGTRAGVRRQLKLLAARVERDTDDIKALYAMCGFETAEDGMELVAQTHPEALIAPRTRFLLRELFPARQRARGHDIARDHDGPELGF